jgi:large subunit ribosomal protein L23
MEFTGIIIKSYQTEKTYAQQNNAVNPKYSFVVNPKATKFDISIAFQSIYGHKPASITTQLRKPSHVRSGTIHPGFSKLMKIAYITLPKGTKLAGSEETVKENTTAINAEMNDVNVSKTEVKAFKENTEIASAVKKEVEFKEPKQEKSEVVKQSKPNSKEGKPIHHTHTESN